MGSVLRKFCVAKRLAHQGLSLAGNDRVAVRAGLSLALTGEMQEASQMADHSTKRYPQDTWVQTQNVPMLRAALFLMANKGAQSVEGLAPAVRYEMGDRGPTFRLVPVYLRGLAYLRLKQGPAAAAEFQKIIDHPGVVVNGFVGSVAHLGLGRAQVLSGADAGARTAYQDFLALWKDADRDIAIRQQAKAEYAKLQ